MDELTNKLSEHGSSAIETTIVSGATKVMAGGSLTATTGWVISNQNIALIGVLIAFAGFVVNLIFQVRRDRREENLHVAKMVQIEESKQEIKLHHED
jgi:hypothetical protein